MWMLCPGQWEVSVQRSVTLLLATVENGTMINMGTPQEGSCRSTQAHATQPRYSCRNEKAVQRQTQGLEDGVAMGEVS